MKFPVTVIGGINIDLKGIADSENFESDSYPGIVRISPGGVACNIAQNLAQLDVEVNLYGSVGDDHYGNFILDILKKKKVNTGYILKSRDLSTSAYLSVSNKSQSLFYAVNNTENSVKHITAEYIKKIKGEILNCSMVVIDTNLSSDTLDTTVKLCNELTVPVFVSVVSAEKAEKVNNISGRINFLSLNQSEFVRLFGDYKNNDELFEIINSEKAKKYSVIILKKDKKGVDILDVGEKFIDNYEAPEVMIADVCGAGDAFDAGFIFYELYKYFENEKPFGSVNMGVCAAAFALGSYETVSPELSRKKLLNSFENRINEYFKP